MTTKRNKLAVKTRVFSIWTDRQTRWEYVQLNEAKQSVMIVPIGNSGSVFMIKKYCVASGEMELVFPGGKLKSGEDEKSAAERELLEETGLKGKSYLRVMKLKILPNYLVGETVVYKAMKVMKNSEISDTDEVNELIELSGTEVLKKIEAGEVSDARSVAAALKVLSAG